MAFTIGMRQNGPFKYDVYLGFGVYDLPKIHQLQENLEKRDIVCYPKYDAAFSEYSVKTAIVEGVARSQKCLLYVSMEFISDQSYKFEVAQVLHKVKRFSRDMVIVLKDPLADVPHELKEFSVYDVPDARTLENPRFLDGLATALKKGIHFCILRNLQAKPPDLHRL